MKNRILSLDTAAPRYTSYPPATAFVADFPQETCRLWLERAPATGPVSLYVHIPFCEKLCYYCGCFTTITSREDRLTHYVESLIQEMDRLSAYLDGRVVVSHLHFGGGSPTILTPALFTRLMTEIRNRFDLSPSAEIALEADPRQMSEARIATFAKCGVTRLSLGMQDIDQRVLSAVNRPQPFHLSWKAIELCRSYGIRHINLDLMYGLPGQTVETIYHTITTALTLTPDRVAFFGYAHVPWMKKHMRMFDDLVMPDASLRYDLYEMGSRILTDAGYLPVGIDHFCRPTDTMALSLGNRTLRRNFQGYTTDTAPSLIGIGASAIGKFPQGYVQNVADLRLYHEKVASGILPINKGFILSSSDRVISEVISQLMCYMAVDLSTIVTKCSLSPDYFAPALERLAFLQAKDLIHIDGSFIRVHHPHAARLAACAFDPDMAGKILKNRHARAI